MNFFINRNLRKSSWNHHFANHEYNFASIKIAYGMCRLCAALSNSPIIARCMKKWFAGTTRYSIDWSPKWARRTPPNSGSGHRVTLKPATETWTIQQAVKRDYFEPRPINLSPMHQCDSCNRHALYLNITLYKYDDNYVVPCRQLEIFLCIIINIFYAIRLL